MRRHARGLAAGALLALGIWFLAAPSGQSASDKDDLKPLREAIIKMAEAQGGDVKEQAAALAKKAELVDVMSAAFKPRSKGGIGVGPKKTGDGIELKIISMSKKTLPAPELRNQSKELIRMAEISRVMAEVTRNYPAPKGKGPPNDWKKYADQMDKLSGDLTRAIKTGNPATVKKATSNLNDNCTSCHTDFRD